MRARKTRDAIFIDALRQEVRATRQRPDKVESRIGHRNITPVKLEDGLCLYAQAAKGRRKYGFYIEGYPFALQGSGIVMPCAPAGEEVSAECPWGVDEVRKRVTFFNE